MLPVVNGSKRTGLPVAALLVDLGAPPAEALHPAGVYEDEEDNDDTESEARVEGGAEGHSVLAPPGVCAALDEVVEEEADEGPDGEVEPRGGRDPAHGAKDDGQVDLADEAVLLAAAVEPGGDGQEGAEREAPDEGAVDCAGAKELAGPDDAPEDGAVEVDAGDGAGEAVDGLGGADAPDVGEHPVEDADLGDGGDERSGDLDGEHDARRDLHVVAELEVGGELDALGRGDVAIGDEDHVGDGAAGEGDAADELADEVDAAVLVGDGHDDAVGDEEDGADG